ncbi:hypothetical protein [Corallococcus sp. Z5C101001]|uniref:hypothetical protein n=1 Tax=Corallococcus sp. Z5C101001 TaxID=2596829 RepID=UPI00117C037A|nr:hypothetical protein [Corallococcus sp. Z5C101001]TSC32389.1 hypothetical protein FOF48_10130 [Corallococcus sp. Z5C101001]
MRRSFAVGSEVAWVAWGEGAGLARWVGTCPRPLKEGDAVTLEDGTHVTVVRQVPPRQLRLRLAREDWPRARTVQLRLLPSVHGVTVALHVEGLQDVGTRDETLARWTHALESWDAFSGRRVEVSPAGDAPTREPPGRAGAQKPPALEKGLAERGARALATPPPTRGVKKATATRKSPSSQVARGAKKVATTKQGGGAKKSAPARGSGGARKVASTKPLGAAKKSAPARGSGGAKRVASTKKAAPVRGSGGVKRAASTKPRGVVKRSASVRGVGAAKKSAPARSARNGTRAK